MCVLAALLIGRYVIPSGKGGASSHEANQTMPGVPSGQSARADEPGVAGGVMRDVNPTGGYATGGADPARSNATGVFINGRELTGEQAMAIAATYHYAPVPGHYWYDTRSGAWGIEGREAAGFLLPGHDFGPLSPNASAGNTGVFINGRQINVIEAARLQQTFGAVYPGHWWLDGRTGYYGLEGNPLPLGNIIAALRSQQSGRGGDNFWCSTTACGNDNGQSGYVDVGGTIVGYDH
ncbi:MAG TPA: hypothetical protein VEC59_13280 [Steroidobacteraceae bacterium]|nr:hypothetical protein [Steroidobacteraceae bacterium]